MTIALNIFLASAVLIGIVTLLARSILSSAEPTTAKASASPVEPATVRGARVRNHRPTLGHQPVGVH